MPIAMHQMRTAIQIWISATCLPQSLAIRLVSPASRKESWLRRGSCGCVYSIFAKALALVSRWIDHFVAGDGPKTYGFPWLCVPKRRNDGIGTTRGISTMAFEGIIGTIGVNRPNVWIFVYLVEQFKQHAASSILLVATSTTQIHSLSSPRPIDVVRLHLLI